MFTVYSSIGLVINTPIHIYNIYCIKCQPSTPKNPWISCFKGPYNKRPRTL